MTRPVDHLAGRDGLRVELLEASTPEELAEQRSWFVAEMASTDEGEGMYRGAAHRRGRHVVLCDETAERTHRATGRADDI